MNDTIKVTKDQSINHLHENNGTTEKIKKERWIPYNGKCPQKGKWPCKLVIHIVYLNGKPRENIDFGFYKEGKWTNRQGREMTEVTHYRELPNFPNKKPPFPYPTSR